MPASELVHVPTKESSLRAPTPILDQQHHHTPAKTQALTRPLSEQSPLELSPADPTRGQRLKTDSKKRYTYFVSDAVGRRPPTRMAWHGPPHTEHTERSRRCNRTVVVAAAAAVAGLSRLSQICRGCRGGVAARPSLSRSVAARVATVARTVAGRRHVPSHGVAPPTNKGLPL